MRLLKRSPWPSAPWKSCGAATGRRLPKVNQQGRALLQQPGESLRPFRNWLSGVQLVEQPLRLLQIKRFKSFRESCTETGAILHSASNRPWYLRIMLRAKTAKKPLRLFDLGELRRQRKALERRRQHGMRVNGAAD
jgi:hypothetical protein